MIEDYDVTEDLLSPREEKPNQQHQPKRQRKNNRGVLIIILAAAVAVIAFFGYRILILGNKTDNTDRGNTNANMLMCSTQDEYVRGGAVVQAGKWTYLF